MLLESNQHQETIIISLWWSTTNKIPQVPPVHLKIKTNMAAVQNITEKQGGGASAVDWGEEAWL